MVNTHTHQGGHSPVMIKFPDFSLTFPDISSQNLRSIDPHSGSDTKQNACYFSLQYSYIVITMTTMFFTILPACNKRPFLTCDYLMHYFT